MTLRARHRVSWLIASCLAAMPCLAGTTAELKGRVIGAAGQPLPGVTIVVRNDGLSVGEKGAVTDPDGRYRIPQLPPGPGYRVRASLATYAPIEFSDIELVSNQSYVLDISLRPASDVQETVRVRGQAQVVDTQTVTTSTTFSSEVIAGLPLLGRDYQDILTLAPGVSDVNGTGNPNVHGARDTSFVTLVDGVSVSDPFTGYYGQALNIESIEEIEVITAGAPAEYSRAQGGFANIITKSGGNEFKGEFKFFMRSYRLDGDGAGVESTELHGGLGGAQASRDLQFTDYYPFLSFSGPLRKDRAWYYVTGEHTQIETPVNDLTQAFVKRSRGYRGFGKVTWQMAASQKLAFSVNVDRTENENEGVTSLKDLSAGYTLTRGGPTYTLRETAVFGPDTLLESTASWFDNSFQRTPTTSPDTNGNGVLYVDFNHDGMFQARERDPGEDWDRDGRYDVSEYWTGQDLDDDGHYTSWAGCEGFDHEDLDCSGIIDQEVDENMNGKVDLTEDVGLDCEDPYRCPNNFLPGTRGNGKFDTEDKNGNGLLDTVGDSGFTPFPFWLDKNGNYRPDRGEFKAPLPPDRESFTDQFGRTQGSDPYQYEDHRTRLSLREDFSFYVPDAWGSHDLKLGAIYEHEGYDSNTMRRGKISGSTAFTGWPVSVNNTAVGDNLGLYVQDTYKPLPNLTLGLGLRFDFESISSFGFVPFNPAAERASFDTLLAATLTGLTPGGITQLGLLCGDPLYSTCESPRVASLNTSLRTLLPGRLTRHNSEFDIQSNNLSGILGRDVTLQDLLAAGINIRQPENIGWTNNNLAPRLFVSWDPFAEGKTKAFASWNRFYDKLFLNSVVLEEGPDILTRSYVFDRDGVDSSGLPDNFLGKAVSQDGPTIYMVSRNLATPYTDELTLGFQQEIAPELSISLTYIRRDYEKQLQDSDVNHHMKINPATGRPVDDRGETECPASFGTGFGQGFCNSVNNGLPDLFIQNFLFNQILLVENTNQQAYRGYELELVRRLSRKWQMQGSYTFSKSTGDAENYLSDLGNDPAVKQYEAGFMDYDQRHVVKFNATAFLPHDWRLGGVAQWASGLPYSAVVRATDADDVGYSQNRIIYGERGSTGVIREGRNMHRNNPVYDFNVRTEKSFVMGKASASAFFEVFNLLNTDDLRVKTIQSRMRNIIIGPNNATSEPDLVWLVDGERRFGRRYEAGIQIDF